MNIEIISAYNNIEEISVLFSEYTNMLIEVDGTFQDYLKV